MPKDVGKSKCQLTGRETRYDLLHKSDSVPPFFAARCGTPLY